VQLWYLALTGALLLIACANVATLLLAQGSRRAHELAVRVSIGARPSRLLRQLLTENLALAIAGGAAGFAVAYIIWLLLPLAIAIPQLPPLLSTRPLLVTAALSLLTVGMFGLVPALGLRRPDIRGVLGAASPTVARSSFARSTLVVLQLAASLVLLVSAGLLIRSLKNVRAADLGFASNQVLEVSVNLRGRGWTPEQTDDFWKRAREAALRVNGVKAAGLGVIPPFQGRMMLAMGTGNGSGPGEMIETLQDFASPEYFDALGIRITEGRAFREDDRTNSDPVVIVNKQLAKRLFNSESAVGRCMPNPMGEGCLRIVGVADNARLNDITGAMLSYMWRPMTQRPMRAAGGILHVRTDGDPARLIATLRAQIGALAPDLPFVNVRGITEVLQPQLAPWRAATVLLSVLSFSGLVLATIGLYGVTAFLVSQRTRELGIRMALGANRKHIISDVLGGGLKLTAVGVAVGAGASVLTARLFRSLMYGVSAIDPVVYIATIALLVVVAVVACLVPARKATRVDPMQAFRS
jgi:predicted permease